MDTFKLWDSFVFKCIDGFVDAIDRVLPFNTKYLALALSASLLLTPVAFYLGHTLGFEGLVVPFIVFLVMTVITVQNGNRTRTSEPELFRRLFISMLTIVVFFHDSHKPHPYNVIGLINHVLFWLWTYAVTTDEPRGGKRVRRKRKAWSIDWMVLPVGQAA